MDQQQTAVGFLDSKLKESTTTKYLFSKEHKIIIMDIDMFNKLLKQANKIFQEQIEMAHLDGAANGKEKDGEQYYNETFKSE